MSEFDPAALVATLPESPGVYRMLDGEQEALYVGKAKNLRRRVASYFNRSGLSPRIGLMLRQVARIDTTVTRSEAEALLLENNLIKALRPKYNIIYRDDKSYPFIVVSGDPFPLIGFHRGTFEPGCRYFGPFPNAGAVRESIQLLQKVFRLRSCENSVFQNRSRPCLLHQIDRCSAPCVGAIEPRDYAENIQRAELFLDGRHGELIDGLTREMRQASDALRFEQAAALRDQIRALRKVLHRTYVEMGPTPDADIVVARVTAGTVCVNLAMVRGGRHLGDRPQFPDNAADCTEPEAIEAFLGQHYLAHATPPRIVLSHELGDDEIEGLASAGAGRARISAARGEIERAWVEMALRNADQAIRARTGDEHLAGQRAGALQRSLGLAEAPRRIECFDVSHTAGESPVAACVVWADGRLQRSQYRRYNVSEIQPGDDYSALRQAVRRRYEKVAAGEGVRPDLVLVDGGKGQVSIVRRVLSELGLGDLPAVGVAKGEGRRPGLESLLVPGAEEPLRARADDPALHLIQEIRDEAHRFAITGHRARRARTRRTSRLEDIPGIGPARRKRLLEQFGGMQGVVAATVDDLRRVRGIDVKLARQIFDRLR